MKTLNRYIKKALYLISSVFKAVAHDYSQLSFSAASRTFLKRWFHALKEARLGFIYGISEFSNIESFGFKRLGARAKNLRSILPTETGFAIILPVYQPNLKWFEIALRSCIDQMGNRDELLIGFLGEVSQEINVLIQRLTKAETNISSVRIFYYASPNNLEIDLAIVQNQLVGHSNAEQILLMRQDYWLRPDFLYRFHQVLISQGKNFQNTVIYCDENCVDEHGNFVRGTHLQKPVHFEFPFIFNDFFGNCLSIPRALWNKVGGLKNALGSSSYFNLCLTLESAGAKIQGIPLPLYSLRDQRSFPKNEIGSNTEKILDEYFHAKGLTQGFENVAVAKSGVVVIVPFHNQIQMTIDCLKRLGEVKKNQKLHVIAVNNRSTDITRFGEIKAFADQWVEADFPFNYSKINNHALRASTASEQDFPLVLFLNNDVIVDRQAIEKMAKWFQFEQVGIVGARLFYPDETIQHGGICHGRDSCFFYHFWYHIDHTQTKQSAALSSNPLVTDAVTAACAMFRRSEFVAVEGFDEVQYPIAYSDTDLCVRIRKRFNKICLMTPEAEGIHFESLSRGKNDLEDYEVSGWLSGHLELDVPIVSPRYK